MSGVVNAGASANQPAVEATRLHDRNWNSIWRMATLRDLEDVDLGVCHALGLRCRPGPSCVPEAGTPASRSGSCTSRESPVDRLVSLTRGTCHSGRFAATAAWSPAPASFAHS